MKVFACTGFARAWIINICLSVTLTAVLGILSKSVIFALTVWILLFVSSIFQANLGKKPFRVLTVVTIDEVGLKNCFCTLKWEEIESTGIEDMNNESVFPSRRGILQKNFGLVLLLHRRAADKEKTFVTYSSRDTVCIPYNERTKRALKKYAPSVVKRFNL